MDHVTCSTMQQIMSQFRDWIKSFAQDSTRLRTPEDTATFEHQFRDEGLHMIGSIFEKLLQNALDHQEPIARVQSVDADAVTRDAENAGRLAYPKYKRKGYPISSGTMESFCKQLGQRMKGPGMRWNINNVTVMATLVSLWANDEWEGYWKTVA